MEHFARIVRNYAVSLHAPRWRDPHNISMRSLLLRSRLGVDEGEEAEEVVVVGVVALNLVKGGD